MTKNELLKDVANLFNQRNRIALFTPVLVEQILDCLIDVMIAALRKDGQITIRDFVSIDVLDRSDSTRRAWDPFRHKHMTYSPKKRIRCSFSKKITDEVTKP